MSLRDSYYTPVTKFYPRPIPYTWKPNSFTPLSCCWFHRYHDLRSRFIYNFSSSWYIPTKSFPTVTWSTTPSQWHYISHWHSSFSSTPPKTTVLEVTTINPLYPLLVTSHCCHSSMTRLVTRISRHLGTHTVLQIIQKRLRNLQISSFACEGIRKSLWWISPQ